MKTELIPYGVLLPIIGLGKMKSFVASMIELDNDIYIMSTPSSSIT